MAAVLQKVQQRLQVGLLGRVPAGAGVRVLSRSDRLLRPVPRQHFLQARPQPVGPLRFHVRRVDRAEVDVQQLKPQHLTGRQGLVEGFFDDAQRGPLGEGTEALLLIKSLVLRFEFDFEAQVLHDVGFSLHGRPRS